MPTKSLHYRPMRLMAKFFILTLVVVTSLTAFQSQAWAFFSPGLEVYTSEALDEALQSKRAAKKSGIKKLMSLGLIITGGNAPSGLTGVTLEDWRFSQIRNPGTDIMFSGKTMTVNNWDSVTTWDTKTGKLIRASVCTKDRYAIYGNNADGTILIIGKETVEKYRSVLDLAVYDALTEKKKVNLKDSDEVRIGRKNPRDQRQVDYATSPDGRYFAMTEMGCQHHVWDLATGKSLLGTHGSFVVNDSLPAVSFSPASNRVYITHKYDEGGVYDLPSGKLLMTHKSEKEIVRPQFSPNGKYILFNNVLKTLPAGKTIHTFKGKEIDCVFMPEGDFVYTNDNSEMVVYKMDDDDIEKVATIDIKGPEESFHMWNWVAPGNELVANLSLVKGEGRQLAITLQKIKLPTTEDIKLYKQADKAMQLYKAGLHDQGIALMRTLIKKDPYKLAVKAYYNKIRRARMPLKLSGELLLEFKKQVDMKTSQKSALSIEYSKTALYARQPLAAIGAMKEWDVVVASDPEIKVSDKTRTEVALIKAFSQLLLGKESEYYNQLLAASSNINDFDEHAARWIVVNQLMCEPMFRSRGKLAAVTGIDINDIPQPINKLTKEAFPSFDGSIVYKGAPPKPEKTSPSMPPNKKKKSNSVVLD